MIVNLHFPEGSGCSEDNFIIEVNDGINEKSIHGRYYIRGCELIGVNLVSITIRDFEDFFIPQECVTQLQHWNYPKHEEVLRKGCCLDVELFSDIYLFFVKLGYNDIHINEEPFQWRKVELDYPKININFPRSD